ncbi:MAG: glycine betaine transporter [Gammaproteobacteria bacterium]|jgi:glycine betaine transporter
MASSDVESPQGLGHINKPLFAITGGFIALFCISAIVNLEGLSGLVDVGFAWSAKWFGLYW